MNDKRTNRDGRGVSDVLNFDIDNIYVPTSASAYYPLVDYFLTYSMAGVVINKKAQFIISGFKVDSESPNGRAYGEEIARKLDIKNKFVRMAIYYFAYGLAAMYPMPKVKKTLECVECHDTYPLDKLERSYKPLYRYSDGKYRYKCTNEKCKNKGLETEFNLIEEEIDDITQYNIAVWPPHQMSCIYNSATDKKRWMYKCDNDLRKLLSELDHYTICSTPESFLVSMMKDNRIFVDEERLCVMEYPGLTIKGVPIPPMTRAFQDLYQRQMYQKANRDIAEDILVPLRMLFPIWKGESGMNKPMIQTMNPSDWSKLARREIIKWQEDKSYVPIMPVEIGSKNIWGEGKLLVLTDTLKGNAQDVCANLDVPLEFLVGGATWSRQNVSSKSLENTIKSCSIQFADPLRFIEDKANKSLPKESKITIRLDAPKLVDEMMETSILRDMEASGKVSTKTFLNHIGRDYDEERRNLKREEGDRSEDIVAKAVDNALAQSEAERTMLKIESEKRSVNRKEMLKDSLANRAIEKDQLMTNIFMQELQYKQQVRMQRMSARDQAKMQREQLPDQLEMMRQQLKMNEESQLRIAKKTQKLQALGIKQQIKAQAKAQQELEESDRRKQEKEMRQQAVSMMTDKEKRVLSILPADKQSEMIEQFMERASLKEMYDKMPIEIKQEMVDMSEEEKMQTIRDYSAQIEEEERDAQSVQEDPNLQKEMLKRKMDTQADEEKASVMASEYNRLSPEERLTYRNELMNEDANMFAKVKSIADASAITESVTSLLNMDDENRKSFWLTITQKHPELLEEIMKEYNSQMIYRRQASGYAYKLLSSRGKPEYEEIAREIAENSPNSFKAMIIEEYKKLVGISAEEEGEGISMDQLNELAGSIGSMEEEERNQVLETMRYDDPVLHSKIVSIMQGRKKS